MTGREVVDDIMVDICVWQLSVVLFSLLGSVFLSFHLFIYFFSYLCVCFKYKY